MLKLIEEIKEHKRIVRYDRLFLAFLITLSLLVIILTYQTPVSAGNEQRFVDYTVKGGDTLWGIASHLDSRRDVREIIYIIERENQISASSNIYPGQILQLPVFEANGDLE